MQSIVPLELVETLVEIQDECLATLDPLPGSHRPREGRSRRGRESHGTVPWSVDLIEAHQSRGGRSLPCQRNEPAEDRSPNHSRRLGRNVVMNGT